MNTIVANTLSATLISAGVLSQMNLVRMFFAGVRERRASKKRRSLRSPAIAQRQTAPTAGPNLWRGSIAASLACGVMPALAAAQSAPVPAAEPAALVISTDRPSFSDGTGIVPVGHLQLETGHTFTFRNRDDVETQRHNGPEILARVALIDDRFELRLSTSGYTWARSDDGTGAGFASTSGWSDVSLGFKLKMTDQEGWVPRLALGVQSTIGGGSDNISNQIAEPTIKLLWSYDMGQLMGDGWKGITLGGNANIAWPTTGGNRFTQGQGSVYLAFPIAGKLSGFAEYFVIGPNSKGTDAAHYVDVGGAYLLSDRIQFDCRFGFGLNEEADNANVGLGLSFLF